MGSAAKLLKNVFGFKTSLWAATLEVTELQFCLTDVILVALFIHEKPEQKGFSVKYTQSSVR